MPTPLLLGTCLGNEFELTLGLSSKDTHPILISSNNLFLKAYQVSIPCPGLPAWYLQVNSGLYQIGNGGCSGSVGIRSMCRMLNSLACSSNAWVTTVVVLKCILYLVFGGGFGWSTGYLFD